MKYQKLSIKELSRVSLQEFKEQPKTPVIIVLDNIRSLNNIGSVFRTADAFAIEKIYLCGYTAQPPHREIQKTALGATDSIDWEYKENAVALVNELKEQGVLVYSVEQTVSSTFLDKLTVKDETIAIVMGNEVQGVQQEVVEVCDGVIEIPQIGTKHSLNISVSCGIVLWELFKQKKNYC